VCLNLDIVLQVVIVIFCYKFSSCTFVLCVTPVCGATCDAPSKGWGITFLIVFKKYCLDMNGIKISNYKLK